MTETPTSNGSPPAVAYPVSVSVEPTLEPRNKMTVGFRFILAIPHLLLVGGLVLPVSGWWSLTAAGVLGAVAGICAFIAWFAIIFTGKHPRGLWDLGHFYLRWRVRVLAYAGLFRDEYPPFGDGPYPATFACEYPEGPRDRWSVGLRIFYAIPHIIIVVALEVAWAVTSVIAWFAILFTGRYPEGLYEFGRGAMRWAVRLEAYMLLLRDEYPPFSLD